MAAKDMAKGKVIPFREWFSNYKMQRNVINYGKDAFWPSLEIRIFRSGDNFLVEFKDVIISNCINLLNIDHIMQF